MYYLEPSENSFQIANVKHLEIKLDFISEAALAATVSIFCDAPDGVGREFKHSIKINKTPNQVINTKVPVEHVMYALWQKGHGILNINGIKKAFRSAYLVVVK